MTMYDRDNNVITKEPSSKSSLVRRNWPVLVLAFLTAVLLMAGGVLYAIEKTTDFLTAELYSSQILTVNLN